MAKKNNKKQKGTCWRRNFSI